MPFMADPTDQRRSFDDACQRLEAHLQRYPKRSTSPVRSNGNGIPGASPHHSPHYCEEELCCLPPLLNQVHPSKRLCRTIRVWVAWKP